MIFCRLLQVTVLKTMIICRHNTENQIDQVLFRAQLMDGLFVQYCTEILLNTYYQATTIQTTKCQISHKGISQRVYHKLRRNPGARKMCHAYKT
jgi:hypothetical protein